MRIDRGRASAFAATRPESFSESSSERRHPGFRIARPRLAGRDLRSDGSNEFSSVVSVLANKIARVRSHSPEQITGRRERCRPLPRAVRSPYLLLRAWLQIRMYRESADQVDRRCAADLAGSRQVTPAPGLLKAGKWAHLKFDEIARSRREPHRLS